MESVAPVRITAHGWGWRHASRAAWAVRGLDLDVAPGERVLLLGPSGSGKSTLLAGLAGLLTSSAGRSAQDATGEDEGELLLDGVPADRARLAALDAGQARAGLLLQDPTAQTVLARCGDDVAFGLENHAVARHEIWPRVTRALDAVGLRYGLEHPTHRLSGGERQRLALAGVLALRPGLWLLDEPTSMLDPDGAARLRSTIADVLAETGATCVVVEHRVEAWAELVDRVAVLEPGGGVVEQGSPSGVFAAAGERLAAHGVWVPGRHPRVSTRARSTAGPSLLEARDLAVRPARSAPVAVRGITTGVRAGEVVCLVGPNGSGKSSLALAFGGLIPPAQGRVVAGPGLEAPDGAEPHRWRPRELVSRIGTVFQEPQHQFVAATCAEELAVGPRRVGLTPGETETRVADLLARLGLTRLARANPFTLSGGEQRRLSVATVLATRPRVLILDEPTFGQDALTWAALVRLLDELRAQGAGLVMATHDQWLLEHLADRVVVLPAGDPGAS